MAFKVAVIGSCLSNLTAVQLVSEYGWERLNNAAPQRSDLFLEQIIQGNELPPLMDMQAFFGVTDENFDAMGFLVEGYRDLAGLRELDRTRQNLWVNLHTERFDAILLDNLYDTHHHKLRYSGADWPPFSTGLPMHLCTRQAEVRDMFQVQAPLTAQESADTWIEIIRYFRALQPHARIIFSCAPFMTAVGHAERYHRAITFPNLFIDRATSLGVEVLPPIVVPLSMTKLPEDRDHFDFSVYRAIAGHIQMSVVCGFNNWTNRPLAETVMAAPVDHSATPSPSRAVVQAVSDKRLRAVVAAALGINEARVGEDAAMSRTECWDSLKQIGIVLSVEEAFGVSLPFKTTTEANSVATLRQTLFAAGVRAADHTEVGEASPVSCLPATALAGLADHLGAERPSIRPVDWSDFDTDRNLFSEFARRAVEAPDSPYMLFVKDGASRLFSNGEVLAGAASVARHLSDLPLQSTVAIVLHHSTHLYTCFVGCILAGLVPTILAPRTARQDPSLYRESMQVLFDRVQPAATLTSKEAIDSLPNRASKIIDVDQLGPVDAASAEAFAAEMQASGVGDQIAFLQHSSGTTGHKKGVVLTHRQVLEQVRLYAAEIGVQAGDRIATWLPLYHDMGLITSFILPTVAGCPIVSLDAQEWVMRPTMLLDAIENEGANFCWLPNFAFLHIAKNDRGSLPRDLTSVKMFVNCSEPCRAAAFDTFLERYGPAGVTPERLQVSYAMAENVFAVTQTPAGSATRRLRISGGDYLSSGKALPGVQIELRDDKGAVAAPGEVGEICLRSTSMFKGYHHRPELTAERLVDGWYMTRDLGRIDGGELFVIGRTDDLVIVNGKNIVAHEVEDEIGSLAGVAPGRVLAAAVFNEGSGTSELIVLLERAVGSTVEAQVIEDAVRGTLFSSTSVSPSIVNVLPRGYLIKSSSGKLAREASINKWRESGFVSVVA